MDSESCFCGSKLSSRPTALLPCCRQVLHQHCLLKWQQDCPTNYGRNEQNELITIGSTCPLCKHAFDEKTDFDEDDFRDASWTPDVAFVNQPLSIVLRSKSPTANHSSSSEPLISPPLPLGHRSPQGSVILPPTPSIPDQRLQFQANSRQASRMTLWRRRQRPSICPECGTLIGRRDHLRRHIRQFHQHHVG